MPDSSYSKLWLRPNRPAEWPTERLPLWVIDHYNTYSGLVHADAGLVTTPAIPADVIHGYPPQGLMEYPDPIDHSAWRVGSCIAELEEIFEQPFEIPSVLVATRDFQSKLLGTPYALVKTSRAATSAFAVRQQWTGSGFVSSYIPPVFEGGQLDLGGFAITVVPEVAGGLESVDSANDILAIWTYGGFDRYGNLFSEMWRGALDTSGQSPVYRFTKVTASGPSARRWPMLLADIERQRLILIGGWAAAGRPRDLWTFNLATRKWSNTGIVVPSGVGLEDAAYFTAGSSAYLYSGLTVSGAPSTNLWRLDLGTLQFTQLPKNPAYYPGARTGATLTIDPVDDVLYFYGGYSGSQYRNDLWSYDLGTLQWTRLAHDCQPGASCPPPAQRSALISSVTPGTVSMALGMPTVSWNGTDHEWRFITYENRWMTETARRNLWH